MVRLNRRFQTEEAARVQNQNVNFTRKEPHMYLNQLQVKFHGMQEEIINIIFRIFLLLLYFVKNEYIYFYLKTIMNFAAPIH